MELRRKVLFYKDYYLSFFGKQSEKVKEKIDYVLFVVSVAERIPQKFFQHLEGTNGLYEIRIEAQSNIYRIFCCFDNGNVVVLFNAFQKKTQKTPSTEIEKAVKIMNDYFDEKLKTKQNEDKNSKK